MKNQHGYCYSEVLPIANYSPWDGDEQFKLIYSTVTRPSPFGHWTMTQIDRYRSYELWKLVEQSSKLKEGSLIEIGTWCGGSGGLIGSIARSSGISDTFYMCDTYKGIVKVDKSQDSRMENGMLDDATYECVDFLINKVLGIENVKILEGIFPDDTSHHIPDDEKFRFCHIDVDVYRGSEDIVAWIWDRLVPGGIIVYDDYGFDTADGVTKHVEEQRSCEDRIVIHNLNGHAIIIKLF